LQEIEKGIALSRGHQSGFFPVRQLTRREPKNTQQIRSTVSVHGVWELSARIIKKLTPKRNNKVLWKSRLLTGKVELKAEVVSMYATPRPMATSDWFSLRGSREEHIMASTALTQKLKPSNQLANILGSSQSVSRAEAVKGLWDYVKKHNLQNPKNKREILADDKLRPLFGKEKITMFEVGKIVNANLS
jgi:upstream activation factor subunit UAF30